MRHRLFVLLNLGISITRNAVNTAIHPPHPFVIFHVALSSMTVVFYVVQIYLGFSLFKLKKQMYAHNHQMSFAGALSASSVGDNSSLKHKVIKYHKTIGACFILFRFSNLVTSYFVSDFIQR